MDKKRQTGMVSFDHPYVTFGGVLVISYLLTISKIPIIVSFILAILSGVLWVSILRSWYYGE